MCLIAVSIDPPGPWQLVIAANRDEFHHRPTAAAAWWGSDPAESDDPFPAPGRQILAGRDLQAGGTWLGIGVDRRARSLRIGALTNIRPGLMSPPRPDTASRGAPSASRGHLVARWLAAGDEPVSHLSRLARQAADLSGFNLFAIRIAPTDTTAPTDATEPIDATEATDTAHRRAPGSLRLEAAYLNNLGSDASRSIRRLGPGLHVASNATLEVTWPKTRRLGDALAVVLDDPSWGAMATATGDDARNASASLRDRLFGALTDRTEAVADAMPATGLDPDRERLLSAAFIIDPVYGTRCSTVIAVSRRGEALFSERSYRADGSVSGTVTERFGV